MAIVTLTLNGEAVSGKDDESLLSIAREHGVDIPTLCQIDGLADVGACRLCLVEVEGSAKLLPACTTRPVEGMVVRTDTEKLRRYRRTIIEFLASEGNHHSAVCVSNSHCELQDLAYKVGLQSVRVPYLYPAPDSGAAYEATPVATYQDTGGRYCREFTTTAFDGGARQEVYGTACRQPDGTGEIVQ